MDYENYIELYEAIFFFDEINKMAYTSPMPIDLKKAEVLNIKESVYLAALRILVVNNLLEYKNGNYYLTEEQHRNQQKIIDTIIKNNPSNHYHNLFKKSLNGNQFFFEQISKAEYEIYSKCNFPLTFQIGQEMAKRIGFENMSVLELGGNSGGLGSALLENNEKCSYTIVDKEIPCMVGREYSQLNKQNIQFVEGDVLNLSIQEETFDYIIIMNLLHDFDDMKCSKILRNSLKFCKKQTKFLIIEDILNNDFEPKEVVMHGLRLAVECSGGKQRTQHELIDLFSNIHYRIEQTIHLDSVHTMLVMAHV